MTLVSSLSAIGTPPTGRLKWHAGDPLGGGLTGLQEVEVGWLLCNGYTLSNTGKYVALYAAVGTKFGAAGTIPDFRDGKVPIPKGGSAFTTEGATGGERQHTLTLAEYPSHIHDYVDYPAQAYHFDPYTGGHYPGNGYTSSSAGGGGAHNNMPPYVVSGYVLVKL